MKARRTIVPRLLSAFANPTAWAVLLTAGTLSLTPALAQESSRKPIVESPIPTDPAPAGFADWNALFAEQNRLNAAADRIFAAINGQQMRRDPQSVADEGYAGLEVKPESREVRLYWRNGSDALPLRLHLALTEARNKAAVRVVTAAYSKQQLLTEARRWVASGLASGVMPKEDGSGLMLDVATPESALAPNLPGGMNVPVEIRYSSRAQSLVATSPAESSLVPVTCNAQTPYNRQCDTEPYYGGARYRVFKPGIGWFVLCSFAFPVNLPVAGFQTGFVTALHCLDRNSDGAYKMDEATLIGLSSNNVASWLYPIQKQRDTSRMTVIGSVGDRVYTGGWQSNTSRGVAGLRSAYVGNFVRPSGASSGEHGNIRITGVDASIEIDGGWKWPVVEAISTTFNCAAAPGDSGGPVFIYSGLNDDWRIYMLGHMIAAAPSPFGTQCPGAVPKGGYAVYFVEAVHSLWVTETTMRTTTNTSPPAAVVNSR